MQSFDSCVGGVVHLFYHFVSKSLFTWSEQNRLLSNKSCGRRYCHGDDYILYYRTRQIVVPFQVAYGWILRWLARIRKLSIPLNCFIWPVLIRFGLIEIIRRNLGRLWPLFLRSLLGFTSKYWLSFTWTNVSPKALQKLWTDLDEIYNSLECKYIFSINLRKVRINSTSVNFPQLGELVWSSNFFIQSKNLNFQCKTSVAV